MTALESPKPSFFDYGFSKINDNGESIIIIDPRVIESVYLNEKHFWLFQSKDGSSLSYKEIPNGCIVYGNKNTDFNWFFVSSQYDSNCKYSEIIDIKEPKQNNYAEELVEAASNMRDINSNIIIEKLLNNIE